jgi:hypothetical protein
MDLSAVLFGKEQLAHSTTLTPVRLDRVEEQ